MDRTTPTHADHDHPEVRWEQALVLTNDQVKLDFPAGTSFTRTTVAVDPARILTLQDVIDDEYDTYAADVRDIMVLYRRGGWGALPPLVANAAGEVVDGGHRLAAALEVGLDLTAVPVLQPVGHRP